MVIQVINGPDLSVIVLEAHDREAFIKEISPNNIYRREFERKILAKLYLDLQKDPVVIG